MALTCEEIAAATTLNNSADIRAVKEQLQKEQRIGIGMAGTLERSMATNRALRCALEKAAQRFEAKGMHSDAFEVRRVLREA
jgi:hypothetical protein